jgi:flagellar biosynthesis protein FlhG
MSNYFSDRGTADDMTRTISITSGKGGVGKTTMVCNMAYELARKGKRVLILDGDMGMANVDIMFGQRARLNIQHVLDGQHSMQDIICNLNTNIDLISGGSGVYGLSRLEVLHKRMILDQVNALDASYDYLLIDTAPGIDDNVLYLNSAAQEIMVIVTPDPSSLTDSYALIKVLHQRQKENRFSIVANNVRDEADGRALFQKLSDVAEKFLCVSLDYKGFVPTDLNLRQSIRSQQLVVQSQARCPAAVAIRGLVENMSAFETFSHNKGGMQFFWQQLSGVA